MVQDIVFFVLGAAAVGAVWYFKNYLTKKAQDALDAAKAEVTKAADQVKAKL